MTDERLDSPGMQATYVRPGAPPTADDTSTAAADAPNGALLPLGLARCGSAAIAVPIAHLAEGCRVDTLGALLHPAPGLLGALRLRGLLVPVFDLGAYTDRVPRRTDDLPAYAVILRANDRLLGIAVDEIEGLLQIRETDVQRIRSSAAKAGIASGPASDGPERGSRPTAPSPCALMSRIVRGSFLHEDRVISVLDVENVFLCPDILSVPASRRSVSGTGTALGAEPAGDSATGSTRAAEAHRVAGRTGALRASPSRAGWGHSSDDGAENAAPPYPGGGADRPRASDAAQRDGERPPAERTAGTGPASEGIYALGRGGEPLLTFSAGGATFALLATSIHATVPRTTIEQNSLSGGACIGSVFHHRQRIPVLRTQVVAGLGRPADTIESEIVLVRTGEEERIGLAVDTINRMITAEPADMRPVPHALRGAHGLFRGVVAAAKGREQVFVLDPDRLCAHPTVVELSALSRPPKTDSRRSETRSDARRDVVRERVRHLVFDVGTSVASPAGQIQRILTLPNDITPAAACTGAGVEGVFLLEGGPVLFVDLAAHLGLAPPPDAAAEPRILLVGRPPDRVGFAVRSVDGIETSEWRRDGGEADRGRGRIVQLGRGEGRQILPALDLQRIAATLTGTPETGAG